MDAKVRACLKNNSQKGYILKELLYWKFFVESMKERCNEYDFKLEKNKSSLGGFEPPTFRLTAERASRLRHRDFNVIGDNFIDLRKFFLMKHTVVYI